MGSDYGYIVKFNNFRKNIKSYQIEIFKNMFVTKNIVKKILLKNKGK
jgi:hypothetical protein